MKKIFAVVFVLLLIVGTIFLLSTFTNVIKLPWQAEVTFEVNGGSEVNSVKVFKNQTITLPTSKKEGCTFDGWYLDSAYESEFKSTTKITSDIILYAKWLGISFIDCGFAYTIYVTETKQIYAYGENSSGQLGDGTSVDKDHP